VFVYIAGVSLFGEVNTKHTVGSWTRSDTRAHAHAQTHSHTQTHRHTHTHTHTQTHMFLSRLLSTTPLLKSRPTPTGLVGRSFPRCLVGGPHYATGNMGGVGGGVHT